MKLDPQDERYSVGMTTTLAKFAVGYTYARTGLHSHVSSSITVSSRSPDRLVTADGRTLAIKIDDGSEYVMPDGCHPLAFRIRAKDWRATVEHPEEPPC